MHTTEIGDSSECFQCFLYWRWPQEIILSVCLPMKVAIFQNVFKVFSLNVTSLQNVLHDHHAHKQHNFLLPTLTSLLTLSATVLILFWSDLFYRRPLETCSLQIHTNTQTRIKNPIDIRLWWPKSPGSSSTFRVAYIEKFFEKKSLMLERYRQIPCCHSHIYIYKFPRIQTVSYLATQLMLSP
jgi:hypothetical protein